MRPQPSLLIRSMHERDIPAVLSVQAQCYSPAMNESACIIRERLAAAPQTAWIAEWGGQVQAYLTTYPGTLGKIGALGGQFEIPAEADCLYLHDLAVAPSASGHGLGGRLVDKALKTALAMGLRQAALVCVQNAESFWQGLGFQRVPRLSAEARAALATYIGEAHYLARTL